MSLPEVYQALQGQALHQPPKVAEVPLTKPGPNQVLIKIAFAPINPSDIGTILGVYGESKDKVGRSVGLEGSGVVAAVGQDLKVPHKVGDRVHVTGPGTMAQYLLSNSESVYPVQQDDLPLEEAACHFVNPGTVAYMGAKIEQGGHKAAIHTAGSSALGKMLIKYLKPKGIKLINIVRRDEYIEELKKEGADFVLNSQAPDFEEKLKELANKEQATIAFDAIAGDLTGKIVSALPSESQVYVYGLLSGQPTITLTTRDLFMDKSLNGLHLNNYIKELMRKGEFLKVIGEVHSLLPTTFKSNIHKVFKLEEINEALEYYKDNSSKGKILVRPN